MENIDNHYIELIQQPNVSLVRALKNLKNKEIEIEREKGRKSYFKKKLGDAKKIGDEWEGKDLVYYNYSMFLEEGKKEKESNQKLAIKRRNEKNK